MDKKNMRLDLPKEGFARPAQVAHAFGVSRSTLYNRIKKGEFPAPIKDGERISLWPVDLIRSLLSERFERIQPQDHQDNQPIAAS